MLKPRLPLGNASASRLPASFVPFSNTSSLSTALSSLNISIPRVQARNASHATQGRANKAAQGPGKRLGAKKGASEPVVPGNIIYRQRGSVWHPGENTVMGRDHTISATAKGFVRYYRDPERDPEKKYIGVVFEQHERLPRPRNAARRRRLGMDAVVMGDTLVTDGEELHEGVLLSEVPEATAKRIEARAPGKKPQLSLRAGYQYRESNWSIGRIRDRKGGKVEPYDPKRWRTPVTKKMKKRAVRMQKGKDKDKKSGKKAMRTK